MDFIFPTLMLLLAQARVLRALTFWWLHFPSPFLFSSCDKPGPLAGGCCRWQSDYAFSPMAKPGVFHPIPCSKIFSLPQSHSGHFCFASKKAPENGGCQLLFRPFAFVGRWGVPKKDVAPIPPLLGCRGHRGLRRTPGAPGAAAPRRKWLGSSPRNNEETTHWGYAVDFFSNMGLRLQRRYCKSVWYWIMNCNRCWKIRWTMVGGYYSFWIGIGMNIEENRRKVTVRRNHCSFQPKLGMGLRRVLNPTSTSTVESYASQFWGIPIWYLWLFSVYFHACHIWPPSIHPFSLS